MSDLLHEIEEELTYICDPYYAQVIDGLMLMIKSLAPQWIPVSERLPNQNTEVLVRYHTDEIGINELPSDTSNWAYDDDLTVTHWMPLPEPPKEQSE